MNKIPILQKYYTKKSISGFSKNKIIEKLKQNIFNKKIKESLFYCSEIIASGYYKDLWDLYFEIGFKYVHIYCPVFPKLYYNAYNHYSELKKHHSRKNYFIKNEDSFRRDIYLLTLLLTFCDKLHFTELGINEMKEKFSSININNLYSYVSINSESEYIHALDEIKLNLNYFYKTDEEIYKVSYENNIYIWINKLLEHNNYYDYYSNILWNIILEFAKKLPKYIFEQITFLHKIYKKNKKDKKMSLFIISVYYLLKDSTSYLDMCSKIYDRYDKYYHIYDNYFYNIKVSIMSGKPRTDLLKAPKLSPMKSNNDIPYLNLSEDVKIEEEPKKENKDEKKVIEPIDDYEEEVKEFELNPQRRFTRKNDNINLILLSEDD